MFAKLLKYEFKNSGKLYGILSLCAIGASVLGSVFLNLFLKLIDSNSDSVGAIMGGFSSMMLWVMIMFSLIAYIAAIGILLILRFYRHLFSDQGYLTFTLPVTTHQLLLSQILYITICTIISAIVVVIGFVILLLPIFSQADADIMSEIMYSFDIAADSLGNGYFITQLILIIAGSIYNLIAPLLAVTIGSLLAKRAKLLASFGIYYGMTQVLVLIQNILSILATLLLTNMQDTNMALYAWISGGIPALFYLAIGIGGYFLMHRLLSKKLNLT